MENSHVASVLVTTGTADIEQRLRHVESWTAFLLDVGVITKVAHERYNFEITTHRHTRTSRVAVRWHPQTSTFVWTSLKGPCFEGSIRLSDDNGWARVSVSVTCWPEGFVANLTDMLARNRTGIDESALHHMLENDPELVVAAQRSEWRR